MARQWQGVLSKIVMHVLDGLRRVAEKIQVHVLWGEVVHAQKNILKSRYPTQTLVEYHSLMQTWRGSKLPDSGRSHKYISPVQRVPRSLVRKTWYQGAVHVGPHVTQRPHLC